MELVDLAPVLTDAGGAPDTGFGVFDGALAAGGRVKAIVVPGLAGASRREIDELVETARRFGAKGLVHVVVEGPGAVRSPIAKFTGEERLERIAVHAGADPGDLILIVADTPR